MLCIDFFLILYKKKNFHEKYLDRVFVFANKLSNVYLKSNKISNNYLIFTFITSTVGNCSEISLRFLSWWLKEINLRKKIQK